MERFLTESQQEAFERLNAAVEIRRKGRPVAGVTVRTIPLVIGSSGSGKSHLISQRLADEHCLDVLTLSAPGWIVRGAADKPNSLDQVKAFLATRRRGLIFIDEICKVGSSSSISSSPWERATLGEIIGLLDGAMGSNRMLLSMGFSAAEATALCGSEMMLIAAGAFVDVTSARRKSSIGFGGDAPERMGFTDAVAKSPGIYEELFARLGEIICISRPTAMDIRSGVAAMRTDLDLGPLSEAEENRLIAEGVASGTGFRWFETYLGSLMTQHPSLFEPAEMDEKEERAATLSEKAHLFDAPDLNPKVKVKRQYLEEEARLAEQVLRDLPAKLALLESKFDARRAEIANAEKEVVEIMEGGWQPTKGSHEGEIDRGLLEALPNAATAFFRRSYAVLHRDFLIYEPLSLKYTRYIARRLYRLNEKHATFMREIDCLNDSISVLSEVRKFAGLKERVRSLDPVD